MDMFKMCLNWKVAGALAVVGVGIFLAAPQLAAAALPLLILAVCPLSMLFMSKAMMGGQKEAGDGAATGASHYTCSMHPDVRAGQPGRCPSCGMALQRVAGQISLTGAPAEEARAQRVSRLKAQIEAMQTQQGELAHEIEELQGDEESATRSRAVEEAEEIARGIRETR